MFFSSWINGAIHNFCCFTGAFFIPYFMMAIFVGMPIFFMELSIGQYSSCGPVTAYRFCPLFAGKVKVDILPCKTFFMYAEI